ncbi:ribosyldihydronicotinamide dehydrogenase [Talaromyces proteolyticus]|uniref:Ribosyldihydronicotinamide dehydrogenase n=1 Tax=Talaromyces proteolyticus TaxID=1131652 RepID=A0AAD4Q0W1_9EURO|nr:ribosyldihydronicotinamide dehydrogenase [Talaromyces proteolyticus]KAH8697862.1 ribosyldihydronicotinamide dehydrogenase [Talaromyces proteolyticus]
MKVFLVFAHPEPQSLSSALCQVAVQELEAQGHEVRVSDLYAMNWKCNIDRDDFPLLSKELPLRVASASKTGYSSHGLTEDVLAEQEKLLWADTVILQFPLWWFTMPAILKGWVDRVFSCGFAYGVGEHNDKRWGDRYGEGILSGKRAMLIVTVGGWADHYSSRGVNGPIEDLLFPIQHGILFYPGLEVLPPFVLYQVDKMGNSMFDTMAEQLRERVRNIQTAKPIPYRRQNYGDYYIPSMVLREDIDTGAATGFTLHREVHNDSEQIHKYKEQ